MTRPEREEVSSVSSSESSSAASSSSSTLSMDDCRDWSTPVREDSSTLARRSPACTASPEETYTSSITSPLGRSTDAVSPAVSEPVPTMELETVPVVTCADCATDAAVSGAPPSRRGRRKKIAAARTSSRTTIRMMTRLRRVFFPAAAADGRLSPGREEGVVCFMLHAS